MTTEVTTEEVLKTLSQSEYNALSAKGLALALRSDCPSEFVLQARHAAEVLVEQSQMKPLLPKDWRKRMGAPPRSARFGLEKLRDECPTCRWNLIDWAYGTCVGFPTQREAMEAKRFVAAYVKRWGDIDFCSFPWDLNQALGYDDEGSIAEHWIENP